VDIKAVPFLHLPAVCLICKWPLELCHDKPYPLDNMTQIRRCLNGHYALFHPNTHLLVMSVDPPDDLTYVDLAEIHAELRNGQTRASPPNNAAPVITGKLTVRQA